MLFVRELITRTTVVLMQMMTSHVSHVSLTELDCMDAITVQICELSTDECRIPTHIR